MKPFSLIYKTTNLTNGMYYIGKHQTYDLNDRYLGSGRKLKKAIKEFGRNNFKREILYLGEAENLDKKEAEFVNKDVLKDPLCYNMKPGGLDWGKSQFGTIPWNKGILDIKHRGENSPNVKRRKKYTIIFNNGKQKTFIGLRKFCKENNYTTFALNQMLIGKRKRHKDIIKIEVA